MLRYWIITLIYVVDDSAEIRETIAALLRLGQLDVQLFSSATEFLSLEKEFEQDDCLVLDNHMPGLSGLDLQAELQVRGVDIAIVFISGNSKPADVVRAVKGGAYQFLQKPFTRAELMDSISEAIAEQKALKKSLALKEERKGKLKLLTPRETQLLDLLCLGHSNKSIASELGIFISTVEFHRANLNKKLGTNSLADLILLYREIRPAV